MEVSALLGEHWRTRVAISRQLSPEISCTKGVNYVCDEKYQLVIYPATVQSALDNTCAAVSQLTRTTNASTMERAQRTHPRHAHIV